MICAGCSVKRKSDGKYKAQIMSICRNKNQQRTLMLGIAPKCEFFSSSSLSSLAICSPLISPVNKTETYCSLLASLLPTKTETAMHHAELYSPDLYFWRCCAGKISKRFINSIQIWPVYKKQVHCATPACCQQPVLLAVYKDTSLIPSLPSLHFKEVNKNKEIKWPYLCSSFLWYGYI